MMTCVRAVARPGWLRLAMAAAVGVLCVPAGAMSAPADSVTVAGGTLDPAYPDADVYLGTPEAAAVPDGAACKVAARYVELVNAGDAAGAAALYSDDAVILEPVRKTIRGRAEVDEFYATRLARMRPHIVAVSILGNDRECMIELANRMDVDGAPRFVLVSIDHFTLDEDGKVAHMVAFARPRRGM